MQTSEKATTIFVFMLLFVCSLFAWDYWHFQKANSSEPDVPLKSYAKAHTFVVASQASSLRYRAKAHTPVMDGAR